MKKNNLLQGAFAVLLLSSPLVGAETEYPASDFKPTVQYQDEEYIAKSKGAASTSGKSQTTPPDAKYPATSFEPKVLYQDTGYKHKTPETGVVPSGAVRPKSGMAALEEVAPESISLAGDQASKKDAGSSSNYLIALVVLALVGFVFFRKRSAPESTASARQYRSYTPDSSGLTGVDRYLQRKQGPVATGVARYLEKQVAAVKEKASSTGVAKYLEKKSIESETGVAKYLRNKS
ncbi:MAG: hypothetical protein ACU83N_16235 [Gammaproteobacteria bacterium]